jgi:hypothetical protein
MARRLRAARARSELDAHRKGTTDGLFLNVGNLLARNVHANRQRSMSIFDSMLVATTLPDDRMMLTLF